VLLGVAAAGLGTASLDSPASATKHDGEHKVWVCHATSGEGELKNGYTLVHVDTSSTQYQAHLAHATTDPKVNRQFGTPPEFHLYDMIDVDPDDNCGGVEPPQPVEVDVVEPTVTGPDCDAAGGVNIPEVPGLVYTESTEDGDVTVTVTAAAGHVLAAGSTTSWTFPAEDLAQWPADDPRCTTPPVTTDPPVIPEDPPVVPEDPPVIPQDPPVIPEDPPVVPEEPPVIPQDPPVVPQEPGPEARGPVPPATGESPAAVGPTAAPTPTMLPTTGSSNWAIFLIGLASVMSGAGLVAMSRRQA